MLPENRSFRMRYYLMLDTILGVDNPSVELSRILSSWGPLWGLVGY
jgi:hypothetical protein